MHQILLRLHSRLSVRTKLLILMGMPLALLLVLSAFLWNARLDEYKTAHIMSQNVRLMRAISATVNHLQRERGRSSLFLNGTTARTDLDAQRVETDKTVQAAREFLQAGAIGAQQRDRALSTLGEVEPARTAVNGRCPSNESFQRYTALIGKLLEVERLAVDGKTTKGIGKRFVNVILLESAKEYAGQMRAMLSGVLAAGKPIEQDMILKVAKLNDYVHSYLTSSALSLDKAASEQIAKKMESDTWHEVDRVFRTVLSKASAGQFGVNPESFFSTITKQIDDIGALAERELESVAGKAAEIQAEATRDLWTLGSGLALAILLAGVLPAVLASRIVGAMRRVTSMLKDISEGEGDLTRRLEVSSQDEIGDMARYFNQFADRLQGVIARIVGNVNSVASSATELTATATQLAGGAEETTSQSAQVAAAAEEMSANMNTMAAATDQMSTSVKTVSVAIEQLTASIGEMARSAERASSSASNAMQLVDASNTQIGDLGNAADQIGKVIEVIQEIAEQTNLLALNATIEAARAGDAGKGFAVVATEVKELAKQTASATDDIRHRIEGIQGSTNQAVKSIGGIGEVIRQVNELSRIIASAVEEQSITTKEIAKNMAESSTSAETVAKGVSESASASREIARIIVGVDQAAKQAAQGAAHTESSGRGLSTVAEQLRSLVGQFKV